MVSLCLRACLDATVPFRSPIQIVRFLPFQNGGKAIFTAEMVAQHNGPILPNRPLSFSSYQLVLLIQISFRVFNVMFFVF